MNLVIITIDTLRQDSLGAYGNRWIETPNMDRLANESMVYDFCFAHSYPTIPHRTDMLTGEYGDPFHPWMPLRYDRTTFVEELGRAGWCTQLIHDTPHLVNGGHNFDWPFHAWTPVRGAEVDRPWIDNRTEWPPNWGLDERFDFAGKDALDRPMVKTYARANRKRKRNEDWNCAQLFTTASEWLQDNRGRNNFVLWLDCFDPHEPWDVPPEFMQKYDKTEGYDGRIDPRSFVTRNNPDIPEEAKKHLAAQYAAKVSWVDHWLGQFLDTLYETGLAENTAVLLTADHGTNIGEHGKFGKGYPAREQEARVPFMLRVPNGSVGRSDVIVQPQDVYATVTNLLGQKTPEHLPSYDVYEAVRQENASTRDIALAGKGAHGWGGDSSETLFTAYDREHALEVTLDPQYSRLTPLGTLDDVSKEHPDIVANMRKHAIDEVDRHGAHPALVRWLEEEGKTDRAANISFWNGYPGPACFTTYFDRVYKGD